MAASGTALAVLGGYYYLSDELTRLAQAQTLKDGRPRLPPGQRALKAWRPMGGDPGDPSLERYQLRVSGEVEAPSRSATRSSSRCQTSLAVDVHCVTGWSVLGAKVKGVLLRDLAERAQAQRKSRDLRGGARSYGERASARSLGATSAISAWGSRWCTRYPAWP